MRVKLLIELIIIGFVSPCRFLDIIENHYEDYEDAIDDKYIS